MKAEMLRHELEFLMKWRDIDFGVVADEAGTSCLGTTIQAFVQHPSRCPTLPGRDLGRLERWSLRERLAEKVGLSLDNTRKAADKLGIQWDDVDDMVQRRMMPRGWMVVRLYRAIHLEINVIGLANTALAVVATGKHEPHRLREKWGLTQDVLRSLRKFVAAPTVGYNPSLQTIQRLQKFAGDNDKAPSQLSLTLTDMPQQAAKPKKAGRVPRRAPARERHAQPKQAIRGVPEGLSGECLQVVFRLDVSVRTSETAFDLRDEEDPRAGEHHEQFVSGYLSGAKAALEALGHRDVVASANETCWMQVLVR